MQLRGGRSVTCHLVNLAAIEAGKHVLSDKPTAHDHRDVRERPSATSRTSSRGATWDIFIGEFVARPVEVFGICETLKMARPDDVEFRDVTVPDRYNEGNSTEG